jgi:predicted phosphodiesterase
MRLWIQSDLHVDLTRGWDLPAADARPRFDVLAVAGDLIPRMERGVAWLRERVPDRPVIYVPGNHEGYGCDVDRTVEKAKRAAEGSKVVVLQNEAIHPRVRRDLALLRELNHMHRRRMSRRPT